LNIGPAAAAALGSCKTRSWESSRSFALELVEIGLLALGIYLVITFAVETVHVIGLSMYPTLDNDDLLIASKVDYHFHPPQRGDIVILKPPFGTSDLIKRVVGLPGDRFEIRDGHVYINGRQLSEPYINPAEPWTVNADATPQTIPPGYYFVMGDNRNHSSDSRAFGPIRSDDIEARAWIRIWPLNRFGFLDGHPTLETVLVGAWQELHAA
jgi:signal peptidase I